MTDTPPEHRFSSAGFFVARTPLLPFDELTAWSAELEAAGAPADRLGDALARDRARLRARLREALARPDVREALFVASPVLDDSLEVWLREPDTERGLKIERSLVRYFSRMTGRATPFGLFAGCSLGRVGERTALALDARAGYRRHTRLDMGYVCALVDALVGDPAVIQTLTYRPNSSLYSAAGQIRYAEARMFARARSYHLVSLEASDYIAITLERAAGGARLADLARALVDSDPEIALDEAEAFVRELVDSQALVPDLEPAVTGPEPLRRLAQRVQPALPEIGGLLATTADAIDELDRHGVGNDPERYRDIARSLEVLPTTADLPRLFQVDLVKPAPRAVLGADALAAISELVQLLHRISPEPPDPLARFRDDFQRRYEAQEVPLVEVLDEETGIGFDPSTGPDSDPSPLIAGLPFHGRAQDGGGFGPRESLLLARLEAALRTGAREVALDARDLKRLELERPAPLPESFAAAVVLLAASPDALAQGEFRVLFEGVSGPSGANLLGRFCHGDAELEAGVRDMLHQEQAHRPDAIYAEIVHLPEGRIGNVIARPVLRDYEIPFLGASGAPDDHQIPITDLTVCVVGDRVVLRSQRLGREVIPRLTNAHNFAMRAIGTYRFLCTVANQGVARIAGLHWGPLGGATFLPRIVHGRYILSRAAWNITGAQLAPLGKADGDAQFAAVQRLRGELGLPRLVCVSDGDNLLPVDLDNALSVDSFVHLVKARPGVRLEEVLPGPDDLCAAGAEGRFTHQLIVPFTRERGVLPAVRPPGPRPVPATARRLALGSDWLYAKLYTGVATADRVLREVVAPLVEQLEASEAVQRWFFIRYVDPDHHLRLRFHGDPDRLHGEVLPALLRATAPLVADGRIWRIQLDTYEREIERYGGLDGTVLCEDVFCADSRACLGIVGLLEDDAGMTERWRLAAWGMDRLLDDLGLDLAAKRSLLERKRKAFGAEFGVDVGFAKLLGHRFRHERAGLDELFDASRHAGHLLAPGFALLRERSERAGPAIAELRRRGAAGALSVSLFDLADSLLHMHANRLLRSNARAHELVIYDFLHRLYESQVARQREPRAAAAPPAPAAALV